MKFCTNLTKFFYKLRTSAKGEGGRGMSNADKCGQGGGGVQKMVILCGRPLWTTPCRSDMNLSARASVSLLCAI